MVVPLGLFVSQQLGKEILTWSALDPKFCLPNLSCAVINNNACFKWKLRFFIHLGSQTLFHLSAYASTSKILQIL